MSPLFSTRCSWPHKRKKWGIYTFIAPFFLITHWPLFSVFFFFLQLESYSLCLSYSSYLIYLLLFIYLFILSLNLRILHSIFFSSLSFCLLLNSFSILFSFMPQRFVFLFSSQFYLLFLTWCEFVLVFVFSL